MSTVKTSLEILFKGVNVMRDEFPLARIFFDIHCATDGIAGYAVWQRNTYRIPLISTLKDNLKRGKWNNLSRDESIKIDDRHFFFKFEDLQGAVTDGIRKEIQILTVKEQLSMVFRSPTDYEQFVEFFKSKVDSKIFSRDDTEVKPSVYIS